MSAPLFSKNIAPARLEKLIQRWNGQFLSEYESARHQLIYELPGSEERFQVRLPLHCDLQGTVSEWCEYVILLVRSGQAAVGYGMGEELLDHKIFRAYMVRKKQGKSQLKYLKSKGKSRAGSRVRLGESNRFFTEINQRLREHFDQAEMDRIALSVSKTLIPFIFRAKIEPPFEKSDPRIYKIPRHIPEANYENLVEVHRLLLQGEVVAADSSIFDRIW